MSDSTLNDYLFRRLDGMMALKKGLNAYSLRHKVLAANIANSETSGYRAQKVRFEEQLQKALDRQSFGLSRSDKHHIPLRAGLRRMESLRAEVVDDDTPDMYNGLNNVDIEKEMAQMATNQIHYSATTKIMKIRYQMLQSSIRGRA
ncbi:MAG: flagellar basal body rod protein FlgB [Candidatus Electryonea clarkiae]|nr:flagellar basal body rod protein FlgB [Candidatus Electryonea clarkiae]